MKFKRVRYALSLIEIMVVIFIIGIIGAVIGVNMKGSLEQGKAFKSEKGSKQVYDILNLELAKNDQVAKDVKSLDGAIKVLKQSGLPHDAKKLIQDGWGHQYKIKYDPKRDEIFVTSPSYIRYLKEKKKMKKDEIEDSCGWMVYEDAIRRS